MKKETIIVLVILLFTINLTGVSSYAQVEDQNYVIINPSDTLEEVIRKAANVRPSKRQYEWQKLELTGFIHFGINTFDDVEWGKRTTDITKFNPKQIDVNQWVKVFKDAGFKLIIITAKHHDGFCLWPSAYTDYDIANTPFRNGKGDIVKDLSGACREQGIKFGVYLSPWDIHEKSYGTPDYNKYFINQLTELLSNYGEISEVWFDGANGEGENGRKQVYDWKAYYEVIRKLQPEAVIAVMGDDVRWVGTESGYGRHTEWSVLPGTRADLLEIASGSQQQAGDGAFIPRNLMDEDLGSREKILSASSLIWYPAEIDVSIRPGWFYHEGEDDLVKTPYKLEDIYYNSVGLNGVLLLNIPPDKRGLIHENDVEALKGMRYLLDETFNENFVSSARISASDELKEREAENILDDDPLTFWTTHDTTSQAVIEISLNERKTFDRAMLQENILEGQRIEKFHLEYWTGSDWKSFAEATTIGYKRLLRFPKVTTEKIKIVIEKSRTNPTLSSFGLYKAPPEITFEPEGASFADNITVKIKTDNDAGIFYTTDGSIPSLHSAKYVNGIRLTESTLITAVAIAKDGKKSLPVQSSFNKAKYAVRYNSEYEAKYQGSGRFTLVDGVTGSTNFNDGKWQGFNGIDVDLIVDLGEIRNIRNISSGYLHDINSFIFLPRSVEYSISEDGVKYSQIPQIKNDVPETENKVIRKWFDGKADTKGRYIRISAKNIGVCPDWHKGAGEKTWIFIDEVSVE